MRERLLAPSQIVGSENKQLIMYFHSPHKKGDLNKTTATLFTVHYAVFQNSSIVQIVSVIGENVLGIPGDIVIFLINRSIAKFINRDSPRKKGSPLQFCSRLRVHLVRYRYAAISQAIVS